MDIRELKDLLRNSTSVLILDNGEPSYVIVDYDVYRKMTHPASQQEPVPATPVPEPVRNQLSPQDMEALERLNKEIQALKDQIAQEEGENGFRE